MRPALLLPLLCLAAAVRVMAARSEGGFEPIGLPSLPSHGSDSGPEPVGGVREASDRLDRDIRKFNEVQAKFEFQAIPEAAPALDAALALIDQARQAIGAGNALQAMTLLVALENRIMELGMLGNRKSQDWFRAGSGSGGGIDSGRLRQDQQNAAEYAIDRVADRLAYLSRRLESGKNPQAAVIVEKVRALLETARREASEGRYANVPMVLINAEPLLNELQRLLQTLSETDPAGPSGPSRDPLKDQQGNLARAEAAYQRVYAAALRMGEQRPESDDTRATALRTRVFELLEKAKDALATGQPEAAKGYCLKADGLLTEWHRSLAGDGKLSPAARERVKAKLDLAADIVTSSGNEKAARILEKARDHFERADRGRAEGRAGVAGVEMDLALKLAAKAVDIARAGSR